MGLHDIAYKYGAPHEMLPANMEYSPYLAPAEQADERVDAGGIFDTSNGVLGPGIVDEIDPIDTPSDPLPPGAPLPPGIHELKYGAPADMEPYWADVFKPDSAPVPLTPEDVAEHLPTQTERANPAVPLTPGRVREHIQRVMDRFDIMRAIDAMPDTDQREIARWLNAKLDMTPGAR